MADIQDPHALVPDGKAGTGAAFILPNSWQTPLAMGDRYMREDNVAGQRAAAARARQEAEQKKLNDKALADLTTLDTSKAWDIDQPAIRQEYDKLIQYAAQAQAAGKPVGDARNTAEWTEAQRLKKNVLDATSASMQQQQQWQTLGKLATEDKDGIYDKQRLSTDLAAYKNAPFAERVKMQVDPKLYVNRAALIGSTVAGLKHEISKVQTRNAGTGDTTTQLDEVIKPEQFQLATQAVLQKPGVLGQMQEAYDALPADQRQRNPNFQAWAEQTVGQELRDASTAKHERTVTHQEPWHGFKPDAGDKKYDQERSDRNQAVTTLVGQYNQLRNGDPAVFTSLSDKYPGLQEANVFNNGITLGKFEDTETDSKGNPKRTAKDNLLLGMYRNPDTGKLYMETSESSRKKGAQRLIEVTDANAYDALLSKAESGKDLKQVLVRNGFFQPGTSTLNLSKLGNNVTPEQVEQQRAQAAEHHTTTVRARLTKAADLFDDKAEYAGLTSKAKGATAGGKGGVAPQQLADDINSEIGAGTLTDDKGQVMARPTVKFLSSESGIIFKDKKTQAVIEYTDGAGKKVRTAPLTQAQLKERLATFKATRSSPAAAPAARKADPAAVGRSASATTSSSTSRSSSSSNTGGAY